MSELQNKRDSLLLYVLKLIQEGGTIDPLLLEALFKPIDGFDVEEEQPKIEAKTSGLSRRQRELVSLKYAMIHYGKPVKMDPEEGEDNAKA